jgi:hypothetical protein
MIATAPAGSKNGRGSERKRSNARRRRTSQKRSRQAISLTISLVESSGQLSSAISLVDPDLAVETFILAPVAAERGTVEEDAQQIRRSA